MNKGFLLNLDGPRLDYLFFLRAVGIYTESYDRETVYCLPGISPMAFLGSVMWDILFGREFYRIFRCVYMHEIYAMW